MKPTFLDHLLGMIADFVISSGHLIVFVMGLPLIIILAILQAFRNRSFTFGLQFFVGWIIAYWLDEPDDWHHPGGPL